LKFNQVRTHNQDLEKKIDEISGVEKIVSRDKYFKILEMHVDLDLEEFEMEDNKTEKRIKVPYIVTLDESSGTGFICVSKLQRGRSACKTN